MDEPEEGIALRRRRNRAEVEQLVAQFRAGELSRTEFCRQHLISLSTLNRYLARQRRAHQTAAGVDLIAVEVRPTRAAPKGGDSGLAVALSRGRRIEVARGFDGPTLLQLLGLLERF